MRVAPFREGSIWRLSQSPHPEEPAEALAEVGVSKNEGGHWVCGHPSRRRLRRLLRMRAEISRSSSIQRIVLRQTVLQVLHDGRRIVTCLLGILGPFGVKRLCCLAPFGELF